MEGQTVRIDKWLKFARFYKKRSDASEAVEGGSVKVNGERVKPSKAVKAGDILTVKKDTRYREYTIKTIVQKQVSSALARELYTSSEPDVVETKAAELMRILDEQDRKARKDMKGKPNKKQMRELRSKKYDSFE